MVDQLTHKAHPIRHVIELAQRLIGLAGWLDLRFCAGCRFGTLLNQGCQSHIVQRFQEGNDLYPHVVAAILGVFDHATDRIERGMG